MTLDFAPAAKEMAAVLGRVRDDQLGAPTPCTESSLGDLVDHVDGLSRAFAAAAAKDLGALTATPPAPDARRLAADWRARVPEQLDALAKAWADPAAWQGTTQVGGVTLPGAVAGQIALDEVVLHGWDIARASGQDYHPDDAAAQACLTFIEMAYPKDQIEKRTGIFGPPVDAPDGAALIDRLVAFSGRDPAWQPG